MNESENGWQIISILDKNFVYMRAGWNLPPDKTARALGDKDSFRLKKPKLHILELLAIFNEPKEKFKNCLDFRTISG